MTENFRKRSREDSQTKIEDEVIAPYVIYFDGFTYTLVKPKEKGIDENIGYYSSLSGALKSTAKLMVNNEKTTTIADFIHRYNEIIENISLKFEL
jgi:hypothetical protein